MQSRLETLEMTTEIAASYVATNAISSIEIPTLIAQVFGTLVELSTRPQHALAPIAEPAVPIKKSVTHSYLICLDCGRHLKTLKRHISAAHGLTPEAYRLKWNLTPDYPVVASDYAGQRSILAKQSGLGQKSKRSLDKPAGKPAGKPADKPKARRTTKAEDPA